MRTNSMENTRSKNRKHKSYTKQKSKSVNDDVDEKEHIMSSVDTIRAGHHLATTPVSPVGNIVDMQGSLDHGSIDKNEDEKNENKINISKDSNKDKSENNKMIVNQETNKKQQDDKDVKSETETVENNSQSENVDAENKVAAPVEIKNAEKEVAADEKNTVDEVSESSIKSASEIQGICHLKVHLNTSK